MVDETSLYCAEKLFELVPLFVISVMAMSFGQCPDGSVSLGLDEEPFEESRLWDEDVGFLNG